MARFLAYTSPARGHLYPITPTLFELAGRGHEVHVLTLAAEVPAMAGGGVRAAAIDPAIEEIELDDWQGTDPIDGIGRVFKAIGKRSAYEIPDLQRAIAELQPDCLLVDITTPGAAAVAEASSLPWARWIPFLAHNSFDAAPSTRIEFLPYSLLPEGLAVVNDARAEAGLPELSSPDEGWRAAVELYLTAEPFELPGLDSPETLLLVGPGVWEPQSAPVPWLEDLGDPFVLVTASSERQGDAGLIHAAIEGLGGSDIAVAVSTAAHDPAEFTAPDNVRLERWLPHLPLIQRAAAVVCHGGMGITQKALAAGVPVCVVPFGRDQFEGAKLVVHSGSGTVVTPDQLSPATLADAVRVAMDLRAGAERVAAGFRGAGRSIAAADAVEGLVGANVAT